MPDSVTCEMVSAALPVFVTVMLCVGTADEMVGAVNESVVTLRLSAAAGGGPEIVDPPPPPQAVKRTSESIAARFFAILNFDINLPPCSK